MTSDLYTNILKVKYSELDSKIETKEDGVPRETFMFINLNYLFDRLEKFFEIKKDDSSLLDTDMAVYNILNLIAHYRYYFFKYLHSNNNMIVFVNEKEFKQKECLKLLKTMCSFFPKIRIVTTNNIAFTKYHCIKEIVYVFRNKQRDFFWFDLDKNNILLTRLTDRNYYRIRTIGMQSFIHKELEAYELLGLDESYYYDCKYYLPFIYVTNPGKRLKEKISSFVVENNLSGKSDRENNLLLNSLYGKPEYVPIINEIFDVMESVEMRGIIRNIFKTWGHHIYDKKIMNFNEMIDTKNIDVQVHKLMCTI